MHLFVMAQPVILCPRRFLTVRKNVKCSFCCSTREGEKKLRTFS